MYNVSSLITKSTLMAIYPDEKSLKLSTCKNSGSQIATYMIIQDQDHISNFLLLCKPS